MISGSAKDPIQNSPVITKVMPIASHKNVTQTILLIAIIQVSWRLFVKISTGITAFSEKGTNMNIDLNIDKF